METAIALAIGQALSLVNTLLPELDKLRLSGAVTPDDQAEILRQVKALEIKIQMGSAYSGPQWEPTVIPPV